MFFIVIVTQHHHFNSGITTFFHRLSNAAQKRCAKGNKSLKLHILMQRPRKTQVLINGLFTGDSNDMHVFARQFSILLQQFFAHVFIHGPAFFSCTVRTTGAQYFSRRTAHNGNCSRVRTNQGSRKRTIAIDLSVCNQRIRLIQLCMVNAQPLCKCNQCIIFC